MVSQLSNKKISYLFTGIIFLVLNIIGLSLMNKSKQAYLNQEKEDLLELVQKQVLVAEHELEEYIFASFALGLLVTETGGNLSGSKFESLAKDIQKQYSDITSLQLAPEGIVNQVYPSNSAFIGDNHFSDSNHQ